MDAKNDRKADSVSMQLNTLSGYEQPKRHHYDVHTVRRPPLREARYTHGRERQTTNRRIRGNDDPSFEDQW